MATSTRRAYRTIVPRAFQLEACEHILPRSAACAGLRCFGTVERRAALDSRRPAASRRLALGVRLHSQAWTDATGVRSRGFAAGPVAAYRSLVDKGKITHDPRQEMVLTKMTALAQKVQNYKPPAPVARPRVVAKAPPSGGGGGGLFGSLFGGSKPAPKAAPKKPVVETLNIPPGAERGLYVYGGCGTGKTFLMDLFHDNIPIKKKRRVHFHEWMIEVHEKLHKRQKANAMVKDKANAVWTAEAAKKQREALKAQGFDGTHGKTETTGNADDLVGQVAQEMMDEAWLLCFDEFQVTHISDAIIMKRLFSFLFERGAIIVATSNRPPEDLYLNGLNRQLFLPFIPMLQERCDVHNINSQVDYRLLSTGEDEDKRVYITPRDGEDAEDTLKLLERKFYRICQNQVNTGTFVEAQGRRIAVPRSGQTSNVAWFSFKDLCDKPLGAADYFAICTMFHTVFVADIPKLTLQERDQVRRCITMIDSFYERRVKLVCTAARDPYTLFEVPEEEKKNTTMDEIFAWDRTVSRLIEMQSVEYLTQWLREVPGEQLLSQLELTSLTDDDIDDLFTRYDKDGGGTLDREEAKFMLEDIMEVTQSHRHVSNELFELMFGTMTQDKNTDISKEQFSAHLHQYGLTLLRPPSKKRAAQSKA